MSRRLWPLAPGLIACTVVMFIDAAHHDTAAVLIQAVFILIAVVAICTMQVVHAIRDIPLHLTINSHPTTTELHITPRGARTDEAGRAIADLLNDYHSGRGL